MQTRIFSSVGLLDAQVRVFGYLIRVADTETLAADTLAQRIVLMERHMYTQNYIYILYKYLRVTHTVRS